MIEKPIAYRKLVWLLVPPIFLLWTTVRHELSHAAVAWVEGARILAVHVLPSIHPRAGFVWGYVKLDWPDGSEPWTVIAAPFVVDALVFLIFLFLCKQKFLPRWVRINCFILGLLSPLTDVGYNYLKIFFPFSDAGGLASFFSKPIIHAFFLMEIGFFAIGIWIAWRTLRQAGGKVA